MTEQTLPDPSALMGWHPNVHLTEKERVTTAAETHADIISDRMAPVTSEYRAMYQILRDLWARVELACGHMTAKIAETGDAVAISIVAKAADEIASLMAKRPNKYKPALEVAKEAALNTRHEPAIAAVVQVTTAVATAVGAREAAGTFKAGSFPALTLSGAITGPRKGGWPEVHSGRYQVDVDGLEGPDEAYNLIHRAKSLCYVEMAYVSPSYGVKIWALGEPAQNKTQHRREWEHVNRAVCTELGLNFDTKDVDPAVKSVNGLCFINHDPSAWYNPEAVRLPAAPPPEPKAKKAAAKAKPKSGKKPAGGAKPVEKDPDAAQAAHYLMLNLPPQGSQTYTDWCGAAVCVAGIWGIRAYERWCEGSQRPTERFNGIEEKIAGTKPADHADALFGLAQKYGWENPKAGRGRKVDPEYEEILEKRQEARKAAMKAGWVMGSGAYPKPVAGDMQNCMIALHELGMAGRFQLDAFDDRVYIDGKSRLNTKRHLPSIRLAISQKYASNAGNLDFSPTKEALLDTIIELAGQNPRNQVVDRIRAEPWDGVDRLTQFGTLAYNQEPKDRLMQEVAALIPRGIVVRALCPGAHFPYCPVLYSRRQGTGKSASLKLLAVARHTEGVQLEGYDYQKKLQERGCGMSVIEIAEMHAMNHASMSNLKSLITDEETDNREAYGDESVNRPFTFIVAGSTNNARFLTDLDHRRTPVLTIADDRGVNLQWLQDNRQQIWAQVADEYDRGVYSDPAEQYGAAVRLPAKYWQEANDRARRHEVETALGVWLDTRLADTDRIDSNVLHEEMRDPAKGFGKTWSNKDFAQEMERLGMRNGYRRDPENPKRRIRGWFRATSTGPLKEAAKQAAKQAPEAPPAQAPAAGHHHHPGEEPRPKAGKPKPAPAQDGQAGLEF